MTTAQRKVDTTSRDEQLERVLTEPDAYFSEAWQQAYEQARAERRTGQMPKFKKAPRAATAH